MRTHCPGRALYLEALEQVSNTNERVSESLRMSSFFGTFFYSEKKKVRLKKSSMNFSNTHSGSLDRSRDTGDDAIFNIWAERN